MDLIPGTAVVLGRDPSCDVIIEGAGSQVSRRHCRLTAQGGGRFLVEDLGSTNGVFVNGRRVHHGAVGPGDTLSLGSYGFALSRLSGSPPAVAWRTLGRDPGCDHVLPMHADGVSRIHARWRLTPDGRVELQDAQSANGLWIHGQRVPGAVVGVGDVVSLGSWSLDLRPLLQSAPAGPAASPAVVPVMRVPAVPAVPSPGLDAPAPPATERDPDWPPRQRGGAGVFLALAAAVLLAIGGVVAAKPDLLDQLGVGALVEQAVPPAEAIAMVSAELQASSSLGQHLDAYEAIAQEIEPYRAHLESAQSVLDTYQQVERYEAFGQRPWPLLVKASPQAKSVHSFMQSFERVVGAARRLHTALTNVPQKARALLDTVASAGAQPSREMVQRLQGSLSDTATQFQDAAKETGPLRQGLQATTQALQAVRAALDSLREKPVIGAMLQALSQGIAVVQEPVDASLGLVSNLDDALNEDSRALERLGTKLGGLRIE